MKKILVSLLCILCFIFTPCSVCAEETADRLYEASGAGNLSAGEILEENGISFSDPESVLSLSPSMVWDMIWDTISGKLTGPLTLFVTLFAVHWFV